MSDGKRTTTEFGHDGDYRELNEEAHPRVPPRLSAPALNWHIGIWNPSQPTVSSNEPSGHEQWKSLVAELLLSILNNPENEIVNINGENVATDKFGVLPSNIQIFGRKLAQNQSKQLVLEPPATPEKGVNPFKLQTFGCSFLWDGQLVKLNIEAHREYVTFTTWIPAFHRSGAWSDNTAALCRGKEADTLRHYLGLACHRLAGIPAVIVDRHLQTKILSGPDVSSSEVAVYLYELVWRRFSDANLRPFFLSFRDREWDELTQKFRSFADFRSIILPSNFPHNHRDSPDPGPAIAPIERFDSATGHSIMLRISDFLQDESGAQAEVSGSLFLNRRAIYASSYGSIAANAHFGPGRSSRYVMVIKPGSRWQLGRLVERLNVLGTYRLGAIRNLPALNDVSESLRKLGHRIDEFQRQDDVSSERAGEEFGGIRQEFADIANHDVVGGLNYRIERSRYYVEAFNRILPGLRIKRIPGYQPYNEFVVRRYSATWDRISRLGVRRSLIQQRLEFINSLRSTAAQFAQSEQQTKQTAEIERQSEAQVSLLEAAEDIGLIPITYYGSTVLGGLLETLTPLKSGSHAMAVAPLVAALYLMWLWVRADARYDTLLDRSGTAHDIVERPRRAGELARLERRRFWIPLAVFVLATAVIPALYIANQPKPSIEAAPDPVHH